MRDGTAEALADLIREVVREVVREELQGLAPGQSTPAQESPDGGVCGAVSGSRTCRKPPHRGRHLYSPPPHEAPPSKWEPLASVKVRGSGSKSYTMTVHSPCKVLGFGKGGGAQDGWHITKIEVNREDPNDINVEINRTADRNGHTRTVKLHKIVYVRPKKPALI